MPKRVINHVFFRYRNAEGRFVFAMRGETHDIPEGEDLAHGEKSGAFTKDLAEPAPPEGTFIPDIEVQWSPAEFDRFVDAGTANEILDKLNGIAEVDRPRVARSLIEAEHRGRSREPLLLALAQIGESGTELESFDDEGPVNIPAPGTGEEPETDGLQEFVESNTIEAIVNRAGDDKALATRLRAAEEARGDKARKSLIEALAKIEA